MLYVFVVGTRAPSRQMGAAFGVKRGTLNGRRWDVGVLVPWIDYVEGTPAAPEPVASLLKLGDAGEVVKAVQQQLVALGFSPGI